MSPATKWLIGSIVAAYILFAPLMLFFLVHIRREPIQSFREAIWLAFSWGWQLIKIVLKSIRYHQSIKGEVK